MRNLISIKTMVVAMVMSVASFGSYQAYEFLTMTSEDAFLLENVEALTQLEQPDINECVSDPNFTCIALHPTDGSKDKSKEKHKWPDGSGAVDLYK